MSTPAPPPPAARPVVAGVDATAESVRAVELAAVQARRRDVPLRIVHAYGRPAHRPLHDAGDLRDRDRLRAVLTRAAEAARRAAPEVEVHTEIAEGGGIAVLLAEAAAADLLVIGHRGLGTLTGTLTGATGLQLAGRTACPLLVVRGDPDDGPVVVGLDDTEGSEYLLEAAFAQALRDGCPLAAVHVEDDEQNPKAAVETAVGAALARVAPQFPGVATSALVSYGRPVAGLVDASKGASVLVVGSRGTGGFRALVLGSVAMGVTQHALCPVLVVPTGHRAGG